ncbi:UNVERIFIED_CONTAM: hypothetical protein Sradi_2856900 [Sesamum radiatum]|uniref:Uncharacterized protein n=1 Tax=Sesamum radiatum TaxID=300843 RepID=A0AAW2RYQ8_SESRA
MHAFEGDVPRHRNDAGFAANILELAVSGAGEDPTAVAAQELEPAPRRTGGGARRRTRGDDASRNHGSICGHRRKQRERAVFRERTRMWAFCSLEILGGGFSCYLYTIFQCW